MHTFNLLTDPDIQHRLMAGEVGILPSDTVYGLMCRAADADAVSRLYQLKHRDHKPGTIIAASLEQLVELGLKRRYLLPVEQYWPGQVSVVIPCADLELVYLHQGLQSLAVRLPAPTDLHGLLEHTGPLLTSSANLPSEPTAVHLADAIAYFGDTVDFYVDGGDLSSQQPSTIVRVVDDAIEVIRRGAVTIE